MRTDVLYRVLRLDLFRAFVLGFMYNLWFSLFVFSPPFFLLSFIPSRFINFSPIRRYCTHIIFPLVLSFVFECAFLVHDRATHDTTQTIRYTHSKTLAPRTEHSAHGYVGQFSSAYNPVSLQNSECMSVSSGGGMKMDSDGGGGRHRSSR